MNPTVFDVVQKVATRHADKRLKVFHIEAANVGLQVDLGGRVLERSNLDELRDALVAEIPGVKVNDSHVSVLRKDPPELMTVATTLTDLHTEPSWLSELLTQVTNGQTLEILEDAGKWCLVRQPDGYIGWAFKSYLAPYVEATPTHWVSAPSAQLFESPAADGTPKAVLLCGTALSVIDGAGEWVKVAPAGNMLSPGWVAPSQLRPVRTLPAADARTQIITDAKRLTGVYYLWGGASPFGLDCSGLAQLTHRLAGYTLPRDAYMQFAAARRVEPPYQPGDLLFFHGDTNRDRITHVGISLGGWDMIHSSRNRNGVFEDNVQAVENLRNTFVGGATFVDRA